MLYLIGDIAITGILCSQMNKNPQRLNEVIEVFEKAKLFFANLEVPIK